MTQANVIVSHTSSLTIAELARQLLHVARKQLIRQKPNLAEEVMSLQLLVAKDALRFNYLYPNTSFVIDGNHAAYDPFWVTTLTIEELVFVWGQTAIKLERGWTSDLKLSHRDKKWQDIAMCVLANAQLLRDGIGTMPENAFHLADVSASAELDSVYVAVRHFFVNQATVTDEVCMKHVDLSILENNRARLLNGAVASGSSHPLADLIMLAPRVEVVPDSVDLTKFLPYEGDEHVDVKNSDRHSQQVDRQLESV